MVKLVSSEASTALLIKKLKQGDSAAAGKLYHQYAKAMFNILIRITNDHLVAEDLLQDSFVKAFNKIHTCNDASSFGAWLKRIVINCGLEHLRNKKIEFQSLEEELPIVDDRQELTSGLEELHQKVNEINKAIQSLPTGTRNIVNLYLLEGYTHEEISAYLGISKSTSKTQYMRGKQLIKRKIMGS